MRIAKIKSFIELERQIDFLLDSLDLAQAVAVLVLQLQQAAPLAVVVQQRLELRRLLVRSQVDCQVDSVYYAVQQQRLAGVEGETLNQGP